jgi:hypothetical protein
LVVVVVVVVLLVDDEPPQLLSSAMPDKPMAAQKETKSVRKRCEVHMAAVGLE